MATFVLNRQAAFMPAEIDRGEMKLTNQGSMGSG